MVPGVIGLLQATEAIKLILGIGEALVGTLLSFDALRGQFTPLKFHRDATCPVCAPGRTVELVDDEAFCA